MSPRSCPIGGISTAAMRLPRAARRPRTSARSEVCPVAASRLMHGFPTWVHARTLEAFSAPPIAVTTAYCSINTRLILRQFNQRQLFVLELRHAQSEVFPIANGRFAYNFAR